MDVAPSEANSNGLVDQHPLLVERMERHNEQENIIDITRNTESSSSLSNSEQPSEMGLHHHHEDRLSSSTRGPTHETFSTSSSRLNSRNSAFTRTGDGYGHRQRSPLNSGLWISVELLVTVGQVAASIVVLSMSRNESPQAPLFAWVVGYASGCVATLPVLYWRFCNRNRGSVQDSIQPRQGTAQRSPPEATSYTAISVNQTSDEEASRSIDSTRRSSQIAGQLSSRIQTLSSENSTSLILRVHPTQMERLNGVMDHFKMVLDCFFAVWFVVGNVWIFGGHSTPADAPKLYKLCIVFLTFSCIGYAMPFIICATICCCLPCIISLLGFREDYSHTRGATMEFINTLPTFKFKLLNCGNVDDHDNLSMADGGILAAGTDKERAITAEDAVCCICLNKYVDNDELRELPCSHIFHVDCVDKWLKINASCPLCKTEIGERSDTMPSAREPSQQ